jgi:bifunctional non-homologous end joining protein LigD
MSRIVKRSTLQAAKSGPSRRSQSASPLPCFILPQLSQPVEKPPSGPQWLHEIKLDGFRMAARIDNRRVQLLTRTGLDWTEKYPAPIAALAGVKAKTAYIDGELCGVDDTGLPSSANTQWPTDGERRVSLVRSVAYRRLGCRCAAARRAQGAAGALIAGKPGLQFNGHESGDASSSSSTRASSGGVPCCVQLPFISDSLLFQTYALTMQKNKRLRET